MTLNTLLVGITSSGLPEKEWLSVTGLPQGHKGRALLLAACAQVSPGSFRNLSCAFSAFHSEFLTS